VFAGVPGATAMEINIVDKYEKLEKVGEGTYGKVYKAQDKATGQLVALKKTRLEMDEEGIPPTALREISLLNLLSHSIYVVRLLAVEQAAKNGKPVLYLVFEFLDTDLKKYLDVYRRGPAARPLPATLIKVLITLITCLLTHSLSVVTREVYIYI
jgi:cyclin-dependent kinase